MLLVAHRTPATRLASERLAAAGARAFESDVQIGDDGRVVVSHFLPMGPLQRDNWRLRRRGRGTRDPLLSEVVALVPDNCLILVDLKETRPDRCARLVAALAATIRPRERFRVCGGRPIDLDALRAEGFATWRTVRTAAELRAVVASGGLPDEAVSIRQSLLTPGALTQLHAAVPAVVAWTVNSVRRARDLRAMGVDGVTTDRIAVLRDLARHI